MKNVAFLMLSGYAFTQFVYASDTDNGKFDIRLQVKEMDIACVPNVITTITSITPEKLKESHILKLEWINIASTNPVIVDLLSVISLAKPAAKVDFDCRWYIRLVDANTNEFKIYISGGGDLLIMNGQFYSLNRKKTQLLLRHFEFFNTLVLGRPLKEVLEHSNEK